MPTTSSESGQKVLVSGANGFIAVWLVRELLLKGYSVRGTVRSQSKATHLENSFKSYVDKHLLEIVVVEDITQDGAFDKAVQGVDAIQHTASPFHFDADDPQELIVPAVRGTLSILNSALKHGGETLKRVVVTSSCASVLTVQSEPKVYSEKDWNHAAIEQVEKEGRSAPNAAKYRASKTLAEKAAWDFYRDNKESIKWDLVVLNPPFIFGPILHEVSSPEQLNTSSKDFWQIVITGQKNPGDLSKVGSAYIDVRDLADAFVLAQEKPEAAGERIIVSAGAFVWQDFIDAANAVAPSLQPPLPERYAIPKGTPGGGKNTTHLVDYDTSKAGKLLGLKYRNKEEVTKAILVDAIQKGW